jgi:hypothetical protein
MNYCELCAKHFTTERCFKNHLKSKSHELRHERSTDLFKCRCGKSFRQSAGLSRHRKKCNRQPVSNTTEPEQIIQVLKEENNKMREEMDVLRKQVEMLMEKSTGNITNNNNNSNSNNNNTHIETQNIILVNSFGNENTDYLTDQIITKLIKNNGPATCIPKIIESIHFDPEHPENHNIKVTNQKNNYAKVIKENKWVTVNKKRTIENMIETGYVLLEEKYQDNKDSVSEFRQNRFRDFQDKYENQDKEMMKIIKDEVDLTVINGTEEIYKK